MKIIGTGLSGLVGSRIVELLADKYEFEDISRKTGTDISDSGSLLKRLEASDAKWVIHMAAYTNVDGAEEQKNLGEQSDAWKINVLGVENVVKAAEATGKKVIYVSTDFVFDGENTPKEGYSEEDNPNPVNWYAKTKYEGELKIKTSNIPWVILRIAYPYRAEFEKNDFMRAIKNRLSQGLEIKAIEDHLFCPTFIDDLAGVFDTLISTDKEGIFHATGASALTPYEAAMLIAKEFGFDTNLIGKTTRGEYFAGKAKRPFDLSMNNDKIKSLGVGLKTFEEGLEEIKKQLKV
ncbi:MAG TPA: NAD(P)-dependent oxidoreductase [Patescibacteria group bacterium]